MDKDQSALWERLKAYRFDQGDASFPYSAKVANENGWNQTYTHRVIEEYRRFAFLAVAAGHPVSPSEAVDQAWHAHILYTRQYERFCRERLGMTLHHGPSMGGQAEDDKFRAWYSQTLASYRAHFGEEPPHDVWPTPEERAEEQTRFQRVDRLRHWVVPKPRFLGKLKPRALLLTAAVPLVVWGCAAQNGALNPLDYDGPSFIQFYIAAFIAGSVAAGAVRHLFRPPNADGRSTRRLDASETAFLNGGPNLVLHSALASLTRRNLIAIKTRSVVRTEEPEPADLTPVERTVLRSTGQTGSWAKDVGNLVVTDVEAIKARLQVEGLVMENDAVVRNQVATWLVALVIPLMGLAKLAVGLDRHRPVGILVALLIVSAIILLVAFTAKKWRSRKGDQVLASLKATQAGFSQMGNRSDADPADYAMAVALFGVPALAGTAIYDVMRPISQPASGSSASTGCGSSCSSSSGGSSCGGGGSGCGGCGGGGGD